MTTQSKIDFSQSNQNCCADKFRCNYSSIVNQGSNCLDSLSDALKVVECSLKWIQISGNFNAADRQINQTVNGIESARAVIGFKDIPSTVESTWASFQILQRAQNRPGISQDRIAEARYNVLKSTFEFTAMATDTAAALNDLKIVDLGSSVNGCSRLFFCADIISNFLNISEKIGEINKRFVESLKDKISHVRRLEISRQDFLDKIQVFNNISCLLGSVAGLVGLAVGGSSFLTIIGLVSSTFWILTKVFSKFYQEIIS